MPRVTWFKIGRYARKVVDGHGVHCKVCDRVINYDPDTLKELRHSCQIPDHPRGECENLVRWDDDMDDCEERAIGARIDQGFDLRSYGAEFNELTTVQEKW